MAGVLLVIGVFVSACASRPDASHYAAVLDQLGIPAGWELAHQTISEPGGEIGCEAILGSCPAVTRYYIVKGQPVDAYADLKRTLIDAGFELEEEHMPGCEGLQGDDRLACFVIAVRGPDLVYVRVYEPGIDPDELGIAAEGQFVIGLRANAKA